MAPWNYGDGPGRSRFRVRNYQPASGLADRRQRIFLAKGLFMLISALVTFLVVILILYLINLLPIDGRAKQICRVIVIVLGVISLLRFIAVI